MNGWRRWPTVKGIRKHCRNSFYYVIKNKSIQTYKGSSIYRIESNLLTCMYMYMCMDGMKNMELNL